MSPRNMHIGFITGGEPFHGGTPEERALGGSETALVQMARSLARRGHEVQVFCPCPKPGLYQGVLYRDQKDLVQAACEERFHVLIVSRFSAALELPLQAGLKVLWNHDILDKPSALGKILDQIDICLVLSRYHAMDYSRRLPECVPKLVTTRNGLDLELISRAARDIQRRPNLVTYVSRPERGLKLLLEQIWPRLKAKLPELSLHICGYQVSHTEIHPKIKQEYEEINRLMAASQGLVLRGGLAKSDYYRHLASSQALLYPCVFPEISCIAALEAQALGTPLVTSDDFALSETVFTPQFRVPGQPGSPLYVDAYVERTLEVLSRPQDSLALAEKARIKISTLHDWDQIAAEWEELFKKHLEKRVEIQAPALAASLLISGDRAAAGNLLKQPFISPAEGTIPEDPQEPQLMDELAKALKIALNTTEQPRHVGVISADQGRSAQALAQRLEGASVRELSMAETPYPRLSLVLIRDRLEREPYPQELLAWAQAWCGPKAWLALCVASGAWPLISPGHLDRLHDLGRREIMQLLPQREVTALYLPRALVGKGSDRFFAGRWLALTPAQGPKVGSLEMDSKFWQVRPAPPEIMREVNRAGLL